MPTSLGPRLPDKLQALFAGTDLAAGVGETFLLLTVDGDGWPHMAMLSVGELLAAVPSTLRAALWLHSTASRNLTREGRGLLALVQDGAGYYLRCQAVRGADLDLGEDGRLAYFELRIQDVLEDAVPYAVLTSGMTFKLHEPEQVLARWQRTIDALRFLSLEHGAG
jgi:hypothetical protein